MTFRTTHEVQVRFIENKIPLSLDEIIALLPWTGSMSHADMARMQCDLAMHLGEEVIENSRRWRT